MRNNILKAIYSTMLEDFSTDSVRAFWASHLVRTKGHRLDEEATYESLWRGNEMVPGAYACRVLRDLEPFLLENGCDSRVFAERVVSCSPLSCVIPPGRLLQTAEAFLYNDEARVDPYELALRLAGAAIQEEMPGSKVKMLIDDSVDGICEDIIAVRPEPSLRYRKEVEAWMAVSLKHFPAVLGLPAFDLVQSLRGDKETVIGELQDTQRGEPEAEAFRRGLLFHRLIEGAEANEQPISRVGARIKSRFGSAVQIGSSGSMAGGPYVFKMKHQPVNGSGDRVFAPLIHETTRVCNPNELLLERHRALKEEARHRVQLHAL